MPVSPYFSTAVGETSAPETCASEFGICANGADRRMTTVPASGVSTPATGSHSGRLVGLRCLSISRSRLNFTAATSTGVPSWNLASARSFNVQDFRSAAIVKLSASCGTIFMSGAKVSSPS